jgi:molybdopterin/thiamine biosynthesis adenylyltransferase
MKKSISTEQAMRYSRHISLAGFDLDKQELLMNRSALLIGAGGLGCTASQYIVASGIGKLTIIDDDIVELTNLHRQILHFEKNIGQAKVDSACSTLGQINSQVELCKLDKRQSQKDLTSLVKQHDIVIDCSDNLVTRNLLNQVCYTTSTPLVSGAAIRMEGQVFCVIPSLESACYACISHFFGEQNLSCVESGVMSPLVGIIGATQAIEAIKILTNYGELAINKLQFYDASQSIWKTFVVNKNPHCKICSMTSK